MVGLLLKKPWRIKVLVNLTTQCQMGCVHCMQDAEPQGEHMTIETFSKVKMFIEKIYKHIKIIMLSGGEPTENPFLPDFISLLNNDWKVILLSNGLFLEQDSYLKNFILKSGVTLQIYNDERYYPQRVNIPSELLPGIVFGDRINKLTPLGRAKKNKMLVDRMSPLCFNLRSAARTLQDFSEAVLALRLRGKMCTPSIEVHGKVMAGESRFCFKIGTVESTEDDLLANLLSMECNLCGLEDNLSGVFKDLIHNKKF